MVAVFISQNMRQPWASSHSCIFSRYVNGLIPAPSPFEILVLFPLFFPIITVTLSLVVCGSTFIYGSIILHDALGQQGSLSHPAVEINNENRPHPRTTVSIMWRPCEAALYFRYLCMILVPVSSQIGIHSFTYLFTKLYFTFVKM